MANSNERVAIIGAGSSGIAACRALAQRGIPFDCFEKGSDVGGLWRYENDNGLASAYSCLHMNTSRETAAYASHPMPRDYPDFPHHTQFLAYLEDYVERFGFREKIRFRTEVIRVEPVDGVWEIESRDADGRIRNERYTATLVASGHHWNPRRLDPALPGTFAGNELHSHFYRAAESVRGKNVLIVGIGDSAMDIACDTSRVSRTTFLTARRGAWIIPKYLGSTPIDMVGRKLQSRSPIAREVASGALFNIGSSLFARRIKRIQGRPEDYGLPQPDARLARAHITASSEILARIGQGRVRPKPWISSLAGSQVRFEDGSAEDIDTIVYCTGYRITLPFLATQIVDPKDNVVPLYKRVVHPDRPGLYFIGLIDVQGPAHPLSELQAEWVADLLEEKAALPSRARMKQAIAQEDHRRQQRFGSAKQRSLHVDFFPYLHALQRERRRRRRRGGRRAPVGQPAQEDVRRLPA
jgi:cation diffusion facilitator CzcD-associated flavoprotein CzcO